MAKVANVARHFHFSTAVLHSTHGTAASQWICWVLARNTACPQHWKSEFLSRGFPGQVTSTAGRPWRIPTWGDAWSRRCKNECVDDIARSMT